MEKTKRRIVEKRVIESCWDSYRFIIIYKSTYEFICLEFHANTEINLEFIVLNIPGSYSQRKDE